MLLIVSRSTDTHTEAVRLVAKRDFGIRVSLLDLSHFPRQMRVSVDLDDPSRADVLHSGGTAIHLDDVQTIWWRRPQPMDVPPEVSVDREFVAAECEHFIDGLLWSRDVHWVNHPLKNRMAARKLVQLHLAKDVGLRTPRTLATNDPDRAAQFLRSSTADIIYKRVGASPAQQSKTMLVGPRDLDRLQSIRHCPTIFQEYIPPLKDVRVIWIGDRFWAVDIDSAASEVPEDSRFDYAVAYSVSQLPADVEDKLRTILTRLGLRYAAIDFRVGRDEEYYFLEINPSGQFLYLEVITGIPLLQAFVAELVGAGARM